MAIVQVDGPSGNDDLRLICSVGPLYLRADTGALEAFDDVADYRIAADDEIELVDGLTSRYTFTVTEPAVLPATLAVHVSDTVTGEVLVSGAALALDAAGDEVEGGSEDVLDATAEILAKLNAAVLRVSSPVLADGAIAIVAGDGYHSAEGRALSWTVEDWSGGAIGSLTAVTLRLMTEAEYAAGDGSASLTQTGTVTNASGDAVFKVELTAAQTGALETTPPEQKYHYVYQLIVTDGGHVQTIAIGACTVQRAAA